MRGSIVWHLTVKTIGDHTEDIVGHGPFDNVLQFGTPNLYNGGEFWDDDITEAEMDLICGVYKLYSK